MKGRDLSLELDLCQATLGFLRNNHLKTTLRGNNLSSVEPDAPTELTLHIHPAWICYLELHCGIFRAIELENRLRALLRRDL